MREEIRNDRDVRLRAALRDSDPAAGDELAPEEVWALRRAALNAADEAGRPAWLPAAALAAGAAAVAAAVVLSLVQVGTEEAPPPRVATRTVSPQTAAAPVAPSPPVASSSSPCRGAACLPPGGGKLRPYTKSERELRPDGTPPPVAEEPIPTQPVFADAVAEPRPLQIQFATPGGTRVIWMLAEESES